MTIADLIALHTGVLDTGATSTGGDYPDVLAALNAKYDAKHAADLELAA